MNATAGGRVACLAPLADMRAATQAAAEAMTTFTRAASSGWVHARIAGHLGWWPATGILPLLSGRMRARVTYRGREYRVFVPAESISVTKPKGAEPCPTTF